MILFFLQEKIVRSLSLKTSFDELDTYTDVVIASVCRRRDYEQSMEMYLLIHTYSISLSLIQSVLFD